MPVPSIDYVACSTKWAPVSYRPWMVTPPFSGIKVEHFETCLLRLISFTLWQIREWHPRLIEDNTRVFLVAGTQLIKSKSLTEHDRVPSVVQKHLLKFRVTQPASTCSRLSNLRLLRSARTGWMALTPQSWHECGVKLLNPTLNTKLLFWSMHMVHFGVN
jgi:hypothetical protein